MTGKKEPLKEAVALSYDAKKHMAPILVAKGKGDIAEKIIQLANDHHIPIQEDPSLVQLLSQIRINESIPDELYQVVAEVFAFIYKVDRGFKKED